jgi:hypothetical protein
VEMMLFVAVVMIGFYYVYKKGALDWTKDETKLDHVPPKQDVSAWLEETAVK